MFYFYIFNWILLLGYFISVIVYFYSFIVTVYVYFHSHIIPHSVSLYFIIMVFNLNFICCLSVVSIKLKLYLYCNSRILLDNLYSYICYINTHHTMVFSNWHGAFVIHPERSEECISQGSQKAWFFNKSPVRRIKSGLNRIILD